MSKLPLLIVLGLFCPWVGQAALDLPVTEHLLSNGMKVIAVERPDAPVVAFALYYRVGSIDEPAGKRGIAHYCEHMMFKSTKNLAGESFARLLGAVGGGHSNANTSSDRTCYHEVIPPDRLELVIRLEAERMALLQPTEEEAASELAVVLEEFRLNYIDDPYGALRIALYHKAFSVHPYQDLTIGLFEDVESIEYDDVMRFQRQYYVPANAYAVVVGNFQTENLLALMERFFGPIPSGVRNPREYPPEPEQTAERRVTIAREVRNSIYLAGYKVPSASSDENLALQVLCTVLSGGGSSPLRKLAKQPDAVAMYAYAYCRNSVDPDLLIIGGMPLPGTEVSLLERKIERVLEDLKQQGVEPEVLEQAKTQILARKIYDLQSSMKLAFDLGEAELVGSWRNALSFEEQLAAITPATIKDLAERYLRPENRTVAILGPTFKTTSAADIEQEEIQQ